jgi:hypothetical protein
MAAGQNSINYRQITDMREREISGSRSDECEDDYMRFVVLMMEAARTSETLVNFYQTTRGYNPEDSRLRTYRRENLKSYMKMTVFWVVASCCLVEV